MLLEHLDLRHASVPRRLPVREQRPNGMRTRPVDHLTESGINPATRPLDAIIHETAEHFLSLLLVCLQGKMSPKMWKRDVSEALRRVPILPESQDLCWAVFGHGEHVWVSKHKSLPFGSTSAVQGWHRVGCLLKDVMVSIFLTPCCRYVDDFFDVDPAVCEYTGGFCLSQVCRKVHPRHRCAPLIRLRNCAGRLSFACVIASGKIGRAFVKPFYAQAHAPMPGFEVSPSLKNGAEWWIKFLPLAPAVKLSVERSTRDGLGLDRC